MIFISTIHVSIYLDSPLSQHSCYCCTLSYIRKLPLNGLPFIRFVTGHIFWHSIWHSIWHIFCHSPWHICWHLLWQIFWHSISHSIWHIFQHFLWHIFWHSLWHAVSLHIATAREYPTIKESNIVQRTTTFRGWKEQRGAQHVTEQYATIIAPYGHGLINLSPHWISLYHFEPLWTSLIWDWPPKSSLQISF